MSTFETMCTQIFLRCCIFSGPEGVIECKRGVYRYILIEVGAKSFDMGDFL